MEPYEDKRGDHKENNSITFLFDLSMEVKRFYETPAIFLTKVDYSDIIFNTICTVRTALCEETDKKVIMDAIVEFHLQWLHAVNELEKYRKRIIDMPREEIFQAISYTIDCMSSRLKYYQKYMEKNKIGLPVEIQYNISTDIEIVEEMNKHVVNVLLDKLTFFRSFITDDEFKLKVTESLDELLNWLDKINDGLSVQLSKYLNFNVPHLAEDLTKTLQNIVDRLNSSNSKSIIDLVDNLKRKGQEVSSMIRSTASHNLEISKVVDKINMLEDRIKRLEDGQSSAVMALVHKKNYLEKRLESIENLKTTLKSLMHFTHINLEEVNEEELCICEDFFQLKIFNHLLPKTDRERLVTDLCYQWNLAIMGDQSDKSLISILSATEIKEIYTDNFGDYYIDEYSRKIYKKPDNDTLYQLNESNVLVPLSDDPENIYFYDECGRYFIDCKSKQRVYKCNAGASEYVMDSSGILLKIKEERDGMTYYYDNYGRYYVNAEGKHIYRESDTNSEYENDGLGNLVRIRSHFDIFDICSRDANVSDDFKYLKSAVGDALRVSITNVILHQPSDPIRHLSEALMKFRANVELREKRSKENNELNSEREIRIVEERALAEKLTMEEALLAQGGSETSYDSHLMKYSSLLHDDVLSATTSSKM